MSEETRKKHLKRFLDRRKLAKEEAAKRDALAKKSSPPQDTNKSN